jgi:hypothetical protein
MPLMSVGNLGEKVGIDNHLHVWIFLPKKGSFLFIFGNHGARAITVHTVPQTTVGVQAFAKVTFLDYGSTDFTKIETFDKHFGSIHKAILSRVGIVQRGTRIQPDAPFHSGRERTLSASQNPSDKPIVAQKRKRSQ